MSNYLTCFPIYVLKRQTLDISFWRQFVLILSHLYSWSIRQYFRFGDVSLKACKVFATFQFVSPIRTQRTKCPSVCSSGLNLYFFSALCRADSLSEGVALQGEACACSKVWLEWKVMRSIETSKPDHGEMIRHWIYCWNDPF